MTAAYPGHWEADVVLTDGGTAHLRPITPDDGERLRDFHAGLSSETIYFRFFAPYPELSARDVRRFTVVDYRDRVALIAIIGDRMVAVVRYDRVSGDEAEVAFVVADAHQGRGLGSVLLEHIAAAAVERGVRRFVADVLPNNRRMISVFLEAGYQVERRFDEGILRLAFPLDPTETSRAVMRAREHRAEARSIRRLVSPASVAVVGANRHPHGVGHVVFRHLLDAGFQGPVFPVHPTATAVAGVRAYPTVLDIPDDVDLAVIALPAAAVLDVVEQCARKRVHGLVVLSAGFGEAGDEGRARQEELVRLARAHGMRVVGPNCLGIINTDPNVGLNASLAPVTPGRGRVGFFSQSGALGVAILETVAGRGLGLSTFVSAGNRADVSGNDLLQFWEENEATDVVLLYLESIGNPRKFTRLCRRISQVKPIVAVKSGRTTQGVPLGHAVRAVTLPDAAVGALFQQAGIIRVDDLVQLFDVAQLLAYQPLPSGDRVAIVGNSDALGLLVLDACVAEGLRPQEPVNLAPDSTAEDFERALTAALGRDDVDAVVTVFVPPLAVSDTAVARVLARLGADGKKPMVTTFLAYRGLPEVLRRVGSDGAPTRGSVPSYPAPEMAVRALARVTRYASHRRRPRSAVPEIEGIEREQARETVEALLAGREGVLEPTRDQTARLLACYGIEVWPAVPVRTADEAARVSGELGYPVALKTAAPSLRHRGDLGGVRLDLLTEESLREAFQEMTERLGGQERACLVVQRMAAPGVSTVVGSREDPSFGGIVSLGVADVATELLDDRAYRLAPLTALDAADLVRAVRAAPLLFGHRGTRPVDVEGLELLLLRVSRLADDLPEVRTLDMNPVIVGSDTLAVLDGELRLARPVAPRSDAGPRRLRFPG